MVRSCSRRLLLAVCLVALLPWSGAVLAEPALDWMSTVDQVMAKVPGARADRARAIAWLAAVNALDAIDPRYREYAPAPAPVRPGGVRPSADAALAAALYTALVVEPDVDHALLVKSYRDTLVGVKSAPEREAGVALGQQAALLLMTARSNDRLDRVEPPATTPGAGVFAMPGYAKMPRSIAMASLAPFGIRSAMTFDPGPPPPVGSAAASREIAEARSFGALASSARSADQTAAALFWNSFEPADFTGLMKTALEARKLDALDIVRIAALDAMISVDSNIVGTALKEKYLHWRPEAAIAGPSAAPADAEAGWQSLVRVPNSPQYPSSGAIGAGILELELPRLFALNRGVELRNGQTGQLRRWPGAAAVAEELASARVWAGVHFRSSVEAGRQVGRQLANEILERQLLPR
ncbi:MAG: vanadium-dependent haloperoxidase [Caldimonas sp.]